MARLTFFLLFWSCAQTWAAQADPIQGTWQFDSYRYQGTERPRPNPDLIMTFQFNGDGTDLLAWRRNGEAGSCERKARYKAVQGVLAEEIFWVNPENAPDCAKDPDMQPDRKSQSPYRLANGRLEINTTLGDEDLTTIWVRTAP